jgi:RNA polymerase sigma-70 factor (ECF subfamily)
LQPTGVLWTCSRLVDGAVYLTAFLDALPAELRVAVEPSEGAALDALLRDKLAEARAAWPALGVDPLELSAHLARILPVDAPVRASLTALLAPDVCVAFACANGARGAVEALEAGFLSSTAVALRAQTDPTTAAEVLQLVRHKILLARGDRPPLISSYGGRGSLRGWLRSIALRTLQRVEMRERQMLSSSEEDLLELPSRADSPELAHMKQRYRADFKRAFAAGWQQLAPRDRNLLRQHFLDALTVDELGTIYGVHRATASRWVNRARDALARGVRKELCRTHGLRPSDLDGLMALVQSQLDVSFARLAAVAPGSAAG